MRRLAPLLLLAAAGCGGSSDGGSATRSLLSVRVGAGEMSAYGTDSAGSPLLALANVAKKTIEVRSLQGKSTYPLPGVRLFELWATGDYLLATVNNDGIDGTFVIDRHTQASIFHAGEVVRARDGNRVVWRSNDGRYNFQTLPDGVPAALNVPSEETVQDLRGDRLVLSRRGRSYGDFSDPDVFRTVDAGGAAVATLAIPADAYTVTSAFLNASGASAGSASASGDFFSTYSENRPYVWSSEGVPAALPGEDRGIVLGFGDDGTILFESFATGRLRLYKGGAWRDLQLPAGTGGALSKDGRTLFAWTSSGTQVDAIEVRP